MKRGKTRKARHSRRRATRRMRGGLGAVAPRPGNKGPSLLNRAKGLFSRNANTVARRGNATSVRSGSVSGSIAAKNYKTHKEHVHNIVKSLGDAILNELEGNYGISKQTIEGMTNAPEISNNSTSRTPNANAQMKNINARVKLLTPAQRQQMKTKRIDVPLTLFGDRETFDNAVKALNTLMKFYKDDQAVGLLARVKRTIQSNKDAYSLSEKLKKEMGVNKDNIQTLLQKLDQNQLTMTEATVLAKTIILMIKDLEPIVNAQKNLIGGGEWLDFAFKVVEKTLFFVFAAFMSAIPAFISFFFIGPGAVGVWVMCMGAFYGEKTQLVSTS